MPGRAGSTRPARAAERRHAQHHDRRCGRVSAGSRTPASAIPRQLDGVLRLVSAGAANDATGHPAPRPTRGRRFTAAAQPRSPADPVEAEVDVLDERVLGATSPSRSCAASFSTPTISLGARGRRAGRAHRAASCIDLPQLGSGRGAIATPPRRLGCTGDPSIPPMAMTGIARTIAEGADADRRVGVALRRRPHTTRAEVVGPRRAPGRAWTRSSREAGRQHARSAPRSRWPSAPSAPAPAAMSSFTTKVTPSSPNPWPRATISAVGALTRSCTTVAPAATARRAVSRSPTTA